MNFFLEIWSEYRPYGIKLAVDFLVAASIYVGLFLFEMLRRGLPITGWVSEFVNNIHAAGAVVALVVFSTLSIIDIVRIYRKTK